MSSFGMRPFSAVAIVAAFAVSGAATAAADWKVYRSDSAGFSAAFPGQPTITPGKTRSGRSRVVYRLNREPLQYRISSQKLGPGWRHPNIQARIISAVRRNLLAKKNYSLVAERTLTQPVPGREIVLRVQARRVVMLTLRVFVVRDRFYQIIFGSDEAGQNDPSGARFLDSFRITYR